MRKKRSNVLAQNCEDNCYDNEMFFMHDSIFTKHVIRRKSYVFLYLRASNKSFVLYFLKYRLSKSAKWIFELNLKNKGLINFLKNLI